MSNEEIKARQLVEKMKQSDDPFDLKQKKQCALICVDEMLNINLKAKPNDALDYVIFWNKVKQQIEKL